MNYISYFISLTPSHHEIEIAQLNLLGVESFIEHEDALEAFIEANAIPNLKIQIEDYLKHKNFSYEKKIHEAKDWNAEWEMNFQAIAIGNQLLVRAPFHLKDPNFEQELIIAPKMAFGTGHHETTSMILEWMLLQHFDGKSVLDYGCGTGILGILAAKNRAMKVCFIDNDPLSVDNTQENILVNDLPSMEVKLGSFDAMPNETYDFILANITRNVLAEGMSALSNHLKHNAKIVMSGFLLDDTVFMLDKLNQAGLHFIEQKQKSDWLCIIAEKQ